MSSGQISGQPQTRIVQLVNPSMRTTGGRDAHVRSGMWDVCIGLDRGSYGRHGCCTLLLHAHGLTLKCQLVAPQPRRSSRLAARPVRPRSGTPGYLPRSCLGCSFACNVSRCLALTPDSTTPSIT